MAILRFISLVLLLISAVPIQADSACTPNAIKAVRGEFLKLYQQRSFQQAEKLLSAFYGKCDQPGQSDGMDVVKPYYWLVSDLMLAKLRAGQENQCAKLGIYHLNAYYGSRLEALKNTKVYSAIETNLALCQKARHKHYPYPFSKKSCAIAGYEHFDAVPAEWQFSAQQGICAYLNPGEPSPDSIDQPPDMDRPYLILLKQDGSGNYSTSRIDFAGGVLSGMEFCGLEGFALGGDRTHRLIKFDGALRYCWPGSAAFLIDSVYELSIGSLIPHNEVFVPIH